MSEDILEVTEQVTKEEFDEMFKILAILESELADAEQVNDNAGVQYLTARIDGLQSRIREVDYLFNPRPKPEICRLCNGHPTNPLAVATDCPECGNPLEFARPADGTVNWKFPDQAKGQNLQKGHLPEQYQGVV